MKKFTKAHIFNDIDLVLSDDGEHTLPIASNLPHRFAIEDGAIVDKYDGITDNQVREKDHETESIKMAALQQAWDEAEVKIGPRPPDLPLLILPEEDED